MGLPRITGTITQYLIHTKGINCDIMSSHGQYLAQLSAPDSLSFVSVSIQCARKSDLDLYRFYKITMYDYNCNQMVNSRTGLTDDRSNNEVVFPLSLPPSYASEHISSEHASNVGA